MSARERGMTLQQFEHLRSQLEFRVDAWLRERGWKSTCETPGSYWLWQKTIDGKTYVTSKDLAERIERNLHGDELNIVFLGHRSAPAPFNPLLILRARSPAARAVGPNAVRSCGENAGVLLQSHVFPGYPGPAVVIQRDRRHPCLAFRSLKTIRGSLSDHTIDSTLCYSFNGVNAK